MTRLANEVREAAMPMYCAACFNQQPSLRHSDFDASIDRGYGNDEATRVAMDDLILCENCVREGARLLDMIDRDDQTIATLEHKLDVAEKAKRQAQNYADTMEEALTKRPEKVHIDHRKKPRKQIEEYA
jgi:hypothetical protein